jgi:hypothetical protein
MTFETSSFVIDADSAAVSACSPASRDWNVRSSLRPQIVPRSAGYPSDMPWVEPEEEIESIREWFGRRKKELWIKPHGIGYHAVVMEMGSESGQALVYYADSEVDAAREARKQYALGQMKDAMRAVGRVAQTQAGQVIIAEVMLGRMKIMKNPFVRQATVGAVVWMADERNRKVLTRVGSATADLAAVSAKDNRVQAIADTSRKVIARELKQLTSKR